MSYSKQSNNLQDEDTEKLKIEAGALNYYIRSWFYRNEEFVAEVYRADIYDEDIDETWELLTGKTELAL